MKRWIAAATLLLPGMAQAQSYQCSIPARIPPIRPVVPTSKEPRRVVPIGGYTLAISWGPQYCHQHARDASARFECGSGNRFGFTLHGLWPDGVGATWPQYCRATSLLPAGVVRQHLCATPSAQLLQHEWTKHGTCMGTAPAAYFARSTSLYARLRYPDMDALSRRPLTAGAFAHALASANPGLGAEMMRITANRQGWLDEVWLCLDKRFAFTRCRPNQGGLQAGAALKIWRGVR